MDKILLLYSGGLDSRLVAKMLNEQNYDLTAVFFRLPFASQQPSGIDFLEDEGIPLEIFDCTRGDLLDGYLDVLQQPKHGRGKGYNPCVDCKLFMIDQLTEYCREHDYSAIATGEVPGQRPMSQTSGKMKTIEQESEMPLIRPLAESGINGRSRKEQIRLAGEYEIDFPNPGGGCLLCEKELATRFSTLIPLGVVTEHTLPLISIGRHYYFPENSEWFVVGRDQPENDVIEQHEHVIVSGKGKPAVFFHSGSHEAHTTAIRLQLAYQEKNQEAIRFYSPWKI